MDSLIDFSKTSLYWSLGAILFNPIFWNVVARAGKILRFFVDRGRSRVLTDALVRIPQASPNQARWRKPLLGMLRIGCHHLLSWYLP